MHRSSVVIVSPALAGANNGNWQTASRWGHLLGANFRVRIASHWEHHPARRDDFMLALHARRSAPAIQAWHEARGRRGLAVVLTGTDLYGDLESDPQTRHSLVLAQQLVVLQELGIDALPPAMRGKARVIWQSTGARKELHKSTHRLRAVMVGHLRGVKSPQTLFDAARLLAQRKDILIDHIGDALEPGLGRQARAVQRDCPNYRWLGALAHAQVRQRIQRAHVLVHASQMEGGAHVIMEAVRSATPVLASHVPGNVGMLGQDYEGYFEHGNAGQLAALLAELRRCQQSVPQSSAPNLLERLHAQCLLRAPLFAPEDERAALLQLLHDLQDPS